MTTVNEIDRERERLNRRIAQLNKQQSKRLRKYRHQISKPPAVEARGVAVNLVMTSHGVSLEAEDILPLCHRLLDDWQIDPCW